MVSEIEQKSILPSVRRYLQKPYLLCKTKSAKINTSF